MGVVYREAGYAAAGLHVEGFLRETPSLHRRWDPYINPC